jgi:hypothetical protein
MILPILFALSGGALCDATPQRLAPDVISTSEAHEGLDWIAEDHRHLLFTRAAADFSGAEMYQAHKAEDDWVVTRVSVSTGPYDAGMTPSPGGGEALFTSTRAGDGAAEGDWNVWRVDASLSETGWQFGEPSPMPAPVNSEKSDCCAVYGRDDEVFFSSDRAGSWNLYRATPARDGYEVALLDGSLNTEDGAWPSAYFAEADALLISSIRKSGAGGDDIYLARREPGGWSAAEILGNGVNLSGYEDGGRLFWGRFYWSSRISVADAKAAGEPGASDIFFMPASCVDALNR